MSVRSENYGECQKGVKNILMNGLRNEFFLYYCYLKENDGEASMWLRTVRGSGFYKYFDEQLGAIQLGKFLD
jgi:hypothetical protein